MSLKILGDIHLGTNRMSHTTAFSREALKSRVFTNTYEIIKEGGETAQLGDLFDKSWVDSKTLRQGLDITRSCVVNLYGNHDIDGRVGEPSGIRFIKELDGEVWDSADSASVKQCYSAELNIQYINHKLTQKLFDASLELVEVSDLLLLHCNVDSNFASDESSLNITKEQVETLLTKVGKIFIAHEHQPRELFDGRVIVTGCLHPTSFSDISDKYIYHVDKDLNVTKELVWCKDDSIKVDFKYVLDASVDLGNLEFIEVTGQAEQSELPAIARAITNLWKTCPNAFMIKNSVTCIKQEVVITETTKLTDTLTTISNELRETKLHAIWQDYLGKI